MNFAACRALNALGVPRAVIATLTGAQGVGRMRVAQRDSRWRADPAGAWRLILPVHDALGQLIDLLAVSSADEDAWSLRTGDGFIWGLAQLEDARTAGDRLREARSWGVEPKWADRQSATLRVFSTPLEYLRGSGTGICVLEWGPAALTELRSLGEDVTLLVADPEAVETLNHALRHGGLPKVRAVARELAA